MKKKIAFPIQMPMEPKLTLPQNRSRVNQRSCFRYMFVVLQTLILHAKFQGNWPSGSGEEDLLRFWAFLSMAAILVMWLDQLYKLSFPFPKDAPHEIWLWLAKRFRRRKYLKSVNGRTTPDAGPWVYYKLTLWAWRLRWAKNPQIGFLVTQLRWG